MNDLTTQALADPARVYPVLCGVGLIRGSALEMRVGQELVRVQAPPAYLGKLSDWCQGENSLAQLELLAQKTWGSTKFVDFVHDLMRSGVMADAATLTFLLAQRTGTRSTLGQAANPALWSQAKVVLPARLPSQVLRLPASSNTSLLQILLSERRSAPGFAPGAVQRTHLTTLLHAAYGLHASGHRTVPSAGGFYRLKLQVVLCQPLERLDRGVYNVVYGADGQVGLLPQPAKDCDLTLLPRAILQPGLLRDCTAVLVISSDTGGALKYRNRAYPLALLEAGAVTQNLALMAAEQGLGWRTLAGYDDAYLAQVCALPGDQQILVAGVLGLPDWVDTPSRKAMRFAWNEVPGCPFYLAQAKVTEGGGDYCWGRDADPTRAHDKALAEALERYAFHQVGPIRLASWGQLPGMVDPRSLVVYSAAQYRSKDFAFAPFDAKQVYAWVAMRDVHSHEQAWVLADHVYARSALQNSKLLQKIQGTSYTYATTSGCASGVDLQMAIANATLELIERDALMRHWLAQQGGWSVPLPSLPVEFSKQVYALQEAGCRVDVQYLHQGTLPVWMVFAQHKSEHFTAVGSSCALEMEAGLRSALSEVQTAVYARLGGVGYACLNRLQVTTPRDHADFYAQVQYFQKADALLRVAGEMPFEQLARLWRGLPQNFGDLCGYVQRQHGRLLNLDMSLENAPKTLAGQVLVTVRVLVPGLIPIGFGLGYLPLGMASCHAHAKQWPHPFA